MPLGPKEIGKLLPLLALNDKDKAVALKIINTVDDKLSYAGYPSGFDIGLTINLNGKEKQELTEKIKQVIRNVYVFAGWKEVVVNSQLIKFFKPKTF